MTFDRAPTNGRCRLVKRISPWQRLLAHPDLSHQVGAEIGQWAHPRSVEVEIGAG